MQLRQRWIPGPRLASRFRDTPLCCQLKRADLKFRATTESVLATIRLEGEVFSKGATKVPLMSGLTVLDARQSGASLPLEHEGTMHTAILTGPSEFSVELDAGIPPSMDAGRASFNLQSPRAGTVRLSLEIPGDHTSVRISPGLITGRTTDGGRTLVEATLVPGQAASVWWTTREIAAPVIQRESRFLSDVKTLASIGEADLRLTVLSDITVVQGEPSQFEVEIPAGYELAGVTGASLESTQSEGPILASKVTGTSTFNYKSK